MGHSAKPANPLGDRLISLLLQRSISRIKEQKFHDALEIIPPRVQTINDLMQFRDIDLFAMLSGASKLSKLSPPKNNGLKSDYDFTYTYGPNPPDARVFGTTELPVHYSYSFRANIIPTILTSWLNSAQNN